MSRIRGGVRCVTTLLHPYFHAATQEPEWTSLSLAKRSHVFHMIPPATLPVGRSHSFLQDSELLVELVRLSSEIIGIRLCLECVLFFMKIQ